MNINLINIYKINNNLFYIFFTLNFIIFNINYIEKYLISNRINNNNLFY